MTIMFFRWLRHRRRQRILATPFPHEWLEIMQRHVPMTELLTPDEHRRLCDDLRLLIAEKRWEGCAGLEITDEIKVTIAAQACLLTLAREQRVFRRVKTILVYPDVYSVPVTDRGGLGVVVERRHRRLGEAWYRGPIVLAWSAVRQGGRDMKDGRNVVLHEFAHKLDMLDGWVDGTPPLGGREQYRQWIEVMTREFERLRDQSERGRATLLDPYGATSPGEFFSVATECFFEKPKQMAKRHPELYEVLGAYYQQDPLARLRAARAK
jgi:hypothetical protein